MADKEQKSEPVPYPFNAFNFAVEITLDGASSQLCSAAFAECDGLEMTMEVKTIREGGNNGQQIRLTGPLSFGQLTLKRGMTTDFGLWDWFAAMLKPDGAKLRAKGEIVVFDADRKTPRARFVLRRCLPTKLKAPALNAKDGIVAIEELQLAYESLSLDSPSKGQQSNG